MLMKTLAYAVAVTLLAIVASGQESFTVTTQMCCDGKVFDKKRGVHCCGDDTYNVIDNGCCGDKQVVDYPNEYDDDFGCCLNAEDDTYSSFNSQTQRCCDGTIVDVDRFDTGVYYVCCGTELIDYSRQSCCGGVAVNDTVGMECCGDEMVPIDSENNEQCCGNIIISTDVHICCSTYEYDPVRRESIPTTKVQDKTGDNDECCGLEVFDNSAQVCCTKYQAGETNYYTLTKPEDLEDTEYPYCCGQEVIVSSREQNSRSCCYGNEVAEEVSYDSETEQCCSGTVKATADLEEGEYCCWYSGEFYQSETQRCTSAGVVEMPAAGEEEEEVTAQDICLPNSERQGNVRYY